MNFTDDYSHEFISKTFYFPKSFPTETASLLYQYELTGCKCDSECRLNKCICMQRSGIYYEFENINDLESYQLREKQQDRPSYECNDNCNCNQVKCGNRLLQFGPRKNLVVRKCDKILKGLGLFTCTEIKTGNFICEYAGEVITDEEAKYRYKYYEDNAMVNYVFCIKEKIGVKLLKTFIDPTNYGNIGRYINHSCDANSKLVVIRSNDTIPMLGIFANEEIGVNSEITYDYGCDSDQNNSNIDRIKCLCMSSLCRSYLPYDNSLLQINHI